MKNLKIMKASNGWIVKYLEGQDGGLLKLSYGNSYFVFTKWDDLLHFLAQEMK